MPKSTNFICNITIIHTFFWKNKFSKKFFFNILQIRNYLLLKNSFIMTIKEERLLSNYIKGLVRESIDNFKEEDIPVDDAQFDEGETGDEAEDEPDTEVDSSEIAGLNELRGLCENIARRAAKHYLAEAKKKKGGAKKKKGAKKKTGKESATLQKLKAPGTNAADYFYRLYGVENGTDAEKASARSKGYKKMKGRVNKTTGARYRFSSKELNRLGSLLTDK